MKVIKNERAGIRFFLDENLNNEKCIFIDLYGNSSSTLLTKRTAINFVKFLHKTADAIEKDWIKEITRK